MADHQSPLTRKNDGRLRVLDLPAAAHQFRTRRADVRAVRLIAGLFVMAPVLMLGGVVIGVFGGQVGDKLAGGPP